VHLVGFYNKNVFVYLLVFGFITLVSLLFIEAVYPVLRGTSHKEGCVKCPQMLVGKPRGMGSRWGEKGSWYLTVCQGYRALECRFDSSVVSERFQVFVNGNELLVPGNAAESGIGKDSLIRNYSITAWNWSD
jgi:hypothetical protein